MTSVWQSPEYRPERVTGRYVRALGSGRWRVYETATGPRGPGMGATLREYDTDEPGVKPTEAEGTVKWPL